MNSTVVSVKAVSVKSDGPKCTTKISYWLAVCNTTCPAYPTTDLEAGEALCSQTNATYQRNVMIFGEHLHMIPGVPEAMSCVYELTPWLSQ